MVKPRWLWQMWLVGALLVGMAAPATVQAAAIPSTYQAVAENERFQLHVDFATLAFKVVDKRSGYVWHSGLDELAPGDRLNKSWQAFAQSGISIEYLDKKAVPKRLSISNAAHTLEVVPIEQGVTATLAFTDVGIALQSTLRLEEDGVRVDVPFAALSETNPDFRLGVLHLYPFLGATRGGSTPGYMLLPDGVGSLIHFADSTKAKNMFYGRYYGADLGMIGALPFDPQLHRPYPTSLPLFGLVHGEGQHALLSVVEAGASYGELRAHPAGIITNFNFIYHAFIYNEAYFQATNRSGAGVITLQASPNAFDVTVHYRFLTGAEADYVGLARSYQRYLAEKGLLRRSVASGADIGVRLEFLGGDKEKVLLWWRFVPMTTVAQLRAILDDLAIARADVTYYGWQSLGASSMPPTTLQIESELGTVGELSELARQVTARGGRFSLYLDPQAALVGEPGYSPRNDLAMSVTNTNLKGFNRNKLNYYLSLHALQRRYVSLAEDVATHDMGLALDGIGWMLYSDFRRNATLNREEASQAYQTLLPSPGAALSVYRPNDYLFGLTQAYYDMPLGDNGYVYTTETVPFLPIVLAGYVPYYGPALNFSPNLQEDILRHLDYGVYPSYFLTHEPTAVMLNTASNWIYTSSYAQWGEQIKQTYRRLNALLGPVRGQEIVARQKLADSVFATTYANGLQVVVNYSDRPFSDGALAVPAKDAVLWQVQP